MAKSKKLTNSVIKKYSKEISKFVRISNSYMKTNNKNKLLKHLYDYQQIAENFEKTYDNNYGECDSLSYKIYLPAVDVRKFIDGFDKMTPNQQEEWTINYNESSETNGIDLCGNKWVRPNEI